MGRGTRRLLTLGGVAAGVWTTSHLRSPAVRTWQPSALPGRRVGRLWVRTGGQGSTGVLLLHGLVATGDVFGPTPDHLAGDHVVAVPDLLGFGRSLDEGSDDFGTEAHLDALDRIAVEVFGDRPMVVGAHSMGSALALRFALRHRDRVRCVVCVGAPIWPSAEAAMDALGRGGLTERALLLDTRAARALCSFNCRHRSISGWVSAITSPRWPVPIARQASLHTWAAYRQAMDQQILDVDWAELLSALAAHGLPVNLIWGDRDRVGDRSYVTGLVDDCPTIEMTTVAGGDHTLPTAVPTLLPRHLSAEPLTSEEPP